MRTAFAALSLLVLAYTGPVSGGVVFSDGFDSENGGNSALDYAGFANWSVSAGTVDLIRSGDASHGITCAGATGSCVDLDGSTFDAGILTSSSIVFSIGDFVEISFQLGGNQRLQPPDNVEFRVAFGQPTNVLSLTKSGDFGLFGPSDFSSISGINDSLTLESSDPFGLYELSFSSTTAGIMSLSFENSGGDRVGAILDAVNVSVRPQAVPEPATLALFALGLAGIGYQRRKHAKRLAA